MVRTPPRAAAPRVRVKAQPLAAADVPGGVRWPRGIAANTGRPGASLESLPAHIADLVW